MPTESGKTEWTREVLRCSLIDPSPQYILWCFGQWKRLYEDLRREIPNITFIRDIPDHLNDDSFVDAEKRHLIVFDDLMTEAKCDQRVADLFTKGSHHRNLLVICLTQNLFPQGKSCRDIALSTQYLVLFNNPMDRQQVATLAKRIYPFASARFMRRSEQTTFRPYGYLIVDRKASTQYTGTRPFTHRYV